MELSIEELAKLKDAVMGNIAITINDMHENLSRYADGLEITELWAKTKSISLAYEICEELYESMEIKNGRE